MPEEIKLDVVLKTQKSLGKYVKKPVLTEKLLKKPPFRFLHDIVNTVIKETGFFKGIFTDAELNSENVKERDAKVAFLTKLIEAVKTITGTNLAVRPSKIVAGLEPTETNLLLQAIAKALEKKLDSSEYVKQLQSGEIITTEKKKPKKSSDKDEKLKKIAKTAQPKEEKPKTKQRTTSNETPKSTDRSKSKKVSPREAKQRDETKSRSKTKKSKEEIKESAPDLHKITAVEEKKELSSRELSAALETEQVPPKTEEITPIPPIEETPVTDEASVEREEIKKRAPSASRPKSARPKSGEFKNKISENDEKEPVPMSSKAPQNRPKSSLRPPSVRPSSARPGAPRLRPDSALPVQDVMTLGKINVIVESFDKDGDEEETVVIQSSPDVIEEAPVEVTGENKGHLVEQILEQINEGEGENGKVEIDWQQDGLHRKDASKETNNLRTMIQTLTKTANPLGKLLNYLHEDIDAMHSELETWTNTKKQLLADIAKQKKISAELNKPLLVQLDNLNQEIGKLEQEIVNLRSNILRNELKIKELLTK